MVEEFKTVETDVLVIGTGAAGLRAAIEADRKNIKVVAVDKGIAGNSGATPTASGGRSIESAISGKPLANLDPKTILMMGCYLNDQDLLWKLERMPYHCWQNS